MGLWFFREALPNIAKNHSSHVGRGEESGTDCSDHKKMPYDEVGYSKARCDRRWAAGLQSNRNISPSGCDGGVGKLSMPSKGIYRFSVTTKLTNLVRVEK